MQYAAGGTLQDLLRRLKPIDPHEWSRRTFVAAVDAVLETRGESPPGDSAFRQALLRLTWPELVSRIGAQLARGLDYAHRAGVLHRDVKPANVLLTREAVPRIADFNVSFGATLHGASAEQHFGGSPAYMAPEQLEACLPERHRAASDLDARSDQYSLGVVLFELLTGSRPFREDSGADRHLDSDRSGLPDAIHDLRAEVAIDQCALRGLDADRIAAAESPTCVAGVARQIQRASVSGTSEPGLATAQLALN